MRRRIEFVESTGDGSPVWVRPNHRLRLSRLDYFFVIFVL
jgi:hypothetical protein